MAAQKKKSIKKLGNQIQSIIILIVTAVIVYILHPLFTGVNPTIPESYSKDDQISWTFYRCPANPRIYQKFSLFEDGRNEVEITRVIGDRDIEMLGPTLSWSPFTDKEGVIATFRKRDIIDRELGAEIFMKAIKSGVMDLSDEKHSGKNHLVIDVKVGSSDRSLSGPDILFSTFAFPPWKWKNRISWQKLSILINRNKRLSPLMAKNSDLSHQ